MRSSSSRERLTTLRECYSTWQKLIRLRPFHASFLTPFFNIYFFRYFFSDSTILFFSFLSDHLVLRRYLILKNFFFSLSLSVSIYFKLFKGSEKTAYKKFSFPIVYMVEFLFFFSSTINFTIFYCFIL